MRFILTPLFLSLSLLSACSQEEQTIEIVEIEAKPKLDVLGVSEETMQASVNDTIKLGTAEYYKFHPQFAQSVQLSQQQVGVKVDGQLNNLNNDAVQTHRKALRALANTLEDIDTQEEQLDEDNRLVVANLLHFFAGPKQFETGYIDAYFGHQPFIISQINGPLIDTIYTFTDHTPLKNKTDANTYISLLSKYAELIKQVEQKFIIDAEQKWLPPQKILDASLDYLTEFVETPAETHSIVKHFATQLDKVENLSTSEKETLTNQAVDIFTQKITPALNSVITTIKKYKSKAPTGDGIWAQPNGDRYYQYAIRAQGDSSYDAEEIHQIGLHEVDRLVNDMDSILTQLGYKQGSVATRLEALAKEPRFTYPVSDEGREQVIDDLNSQIKRINKVMPTQFKTPIKYQVIVKAFPKEIEDGTSGGQYNPPSLDGSKPGVFWINLRDLENLPKFDLATLTFHEANPGHHWQISLNMAQAELPLMRKFAAYNAYIEGWALYAEQVAFEMGMYKNDPYSNLGRLKAELFRAVRLVVDTGIHHKRWTREKAIDYMMDNTGVAITEATAEIERYMVWPGQALGYKLGMLKILELRKQSQTLLGSNFDIGEFHDVVLLNGALPLTLLEQKVNDWIASK